MENKRPNGKYIGYIWYSDQKEPNHYSGDGSSIDLNAFPFIAEGMLWDEEKKISVMLNYTHQLKVAIYNDVKIENPITYKGHKLENLKFTTIWAEEADPLCAGMMVLRPVANVFVGFDNQSKNQ